MDYKSPLFLGFVNKKKKNQRQKYVYSLTDTNTYARLLSDTLAQTNGSNNQAIWKAALFSHLPTYNAPPTCVSAFLKAS